MKKIIGIIAAVAMATSVFAADVSAKVQLEGNLFKFNEDSTMSAFGIGKPAAQTWNPILNLSVNSDRAGASFCLATGDPMTNIGWWQKGYDTYASNFKIWISPFENAKFIFGQNSFNLNQEHITWSKSDSGIDELYGYSFSYGANGFGFDAMLVAPHGNGTGNAGGDPWMSKGNAEGAKAVIGKTGFKVQYGADFGTINGIFVADSTFKSNKFGAGYANNFNGISIFANVLGYMAEVADPTPEDANHKKNSFTKLRTELYVEGSADAFGYKLFPVIEFYPDCDPKGTVDDEGKFNSKIKIPFWARFDYALDGATAYIQIEDPQGLNYIAKDVGLDNGDGFVAKLGATGNVSGASWDVCLRFNLTGKTDEVKAVAEVKDADGNVTTPGVAWKHATSGLDISVPVVFSMSW